MVWSVEKRITKNTGVVVRHESEIHIAGGNPVNAFVLLGNYATRPALYDHLRALEHRSVLDNPASRRVRRAGRGGLASGRGEIRNGNRQVLPAADQERRLVDKRRFRRTGIGDPVRGILPRGRLPRDFTFKDVGDGLDG